MASRETKKLNPSKAVPIAMSEIRGCLTKAIRKVESGERYRIENHGHAVAAVVSMEDLDFIERLERELGSRVCSARQAEVVLRKTGDGLHVIRVSE